MGPSVQIFKRLLSSTAISFALAAPAFAQTAPAAADTGVAEVVVTATRQTSTVNRVPLSISAQTQATLDQQGIKNIADLQRTVPALTVSAPFGGVQTFTIRGVATTQGAATTGVYLDDTSLTKRNITGPGTTVTSNGSPAPPLFDLERVEVLRGPQGTLYGGSSEGGTVRFITPQPSLTRYTGYARAEASSVKDGGTSYEGGVAIGGPIVQDKLGFRVSVFQRRQAGYIDMLDPYNGGALFRKDANGSHTASFHGALAWAPTDRSKVTFSWFHYSVKEDGGPSQATAPFAGSYTTPAVCFNTTRQFGQVPGPRTAVACPATAVPGQTVNGIFQRAAQTYGPYPTLGRNESLGILSSPLKTTNDVAALTFDYDFGTMTMKAITSYVFDQTVANTPGPATEAAGEQRTTAFPGASGLQLFGANPFLAGRFNVFNRRYGISQEVRFASQGDGPLTWVAGVYYANLRGHGEYCNVRDQEGFSRTLWGISIQQAYGQPVVACSNARQQFLRDTEIAGFGEANYNVTEKLTVTGGIRVSRVQYSFNQAFFGATTGQSFPTFANGGLTSGSTSESPITPKAGLQYRFTPNQMVYLTASKGYRAGGVNTPLTPAVCGAALANVGLTVNDIPTTYSSDTVWSYEGGGKFRLFDGRLQLNSSVYRIDWTDVQLTVSGLAGCPQNWVQNAGSARSEGFDVDAQAKLFGGLSASFAVGYTKARYTADTRTPAPPGGVGVPVVRKGDPLPVPVWQGNVGLRYDFALTGRWNGYVRGDYFYQGKYFRSPRPGVAQYAPDSYRAASTQQVNLRAGVNLASWDINLFVNNVFDSADELTRAGGRGGCAISEGAACNTFTQFNPLVSVGTLRPREAGIQTSYRF